MNPVTYSYDLERAKRILGGVTQRKVITLSLTILSVISIIIGLTNLRLVAFTIFGVLALFIFGIFYIVVSSAGENSRHVFGRLTGTYLTLDDTGLQLEAISIPWAEVQRVSYLDRRNEIAESALLRREGTNNLANSLAKSSGQGETLISIIVRNAAGAASVLQHADRKFIQAPKQSTLPEPRPGQFVLSPDTVMTSTEVLALANGLRAAAEARGIPVYITGSSTDFTTRNYAELGVKL